MGRKKVWSTASERAEASRKRREAIDGVNALRLMQFSFQLSDKFILEDLQEAWGCPDPGLWSGS
ncbi:MAG: hypothetical protein M1297_05815 [Nitrospirae bacterium]|jgi:hypothetical protein|nr:hypothetical protein [Nitrospirota bacterium]